MKKTLRLALGTCFLAAFSAAVSQASVILVNYALTTADPTFNRTLSCAQGSCGTATLSSVGTAAHYTTYQFDVSGAGSVTVTNVPADDPGIVNNPAGMDSFILLYGPAGFNPADARQNLIVANDDTAAGSTSRAVATALAAGTYTAVFTSFDNAPAGPGALPWSGTYAIIGDVGPVNAQVPEPATALTLAAGLGILVAGRLRRRK